MRRPNSGCRRVRLVTQRSARVCHRVGYWKENKQVSCTNFVRRKPWRVEIGDMPRVRRRPMPCIVQRRSVPRCCSRYRRCLSWFGLWYGLFSIAVELAPCKACGYMLPNHNSKRALESRTLISVLLHRRKLTAHNIFHALWNNVR